MHAAKRGLFSGFLRYAVAQHPARSLSLRHRRIGTEEKFASCLTVCRSGFELLASTAIKCPLSPVQRKWQKHRTMVWALGRYRRLPLSSFAPPLLGDKLAKGPCHRKGERR
jgi:hypothetical protein